MRTLAALVFVASIAGCEPSVHDVVARGDLDRLESLLEDTPEAVEGRSPLEKTPLHYAVIFGRADAIPVLLANGADVDAVDTTGLTPLHTAAMMNRIDAALVLLEAGAEIGAVDSFGDTPLHAAAMHGQIEAVEMLLRRGAKADALNKAGLTAQDLARRHRRADVVKLLEAVARAN